MSVVPYMWATGLLKMAYDLGIHGKSCSRDFWNEIAMGVTSSREVHKREDIPELIYSGKS